jgi:predicted HTH transcriptional regulator
MLSPRCLRYTERDPITNSTLRIRFGIVEHDSAIASRIVREIMENGLIKPHDSDQGRKYAKYGSIGSESYLMDSTKNAPPLTQFNIH